MQNSAWNLTGFHFIQSWFESDFHDHPSIIRKMQKNCKMKILFIFPIIINRRSMNFDEFLLFNTRIRLLKVRVVSNNVCLMPTCHRHLLRSHIPTRTRFIIVERIIWFSWWNIRVTGSEDIEKSIVKNGAKLHGDSEQQWTWLIAKLHFKCNLN